MTLSIGDHVIKLGQNGEPVKYEDESYIEFEVVDLSPTYQEGEAESHHETGVSGVRYHVVQFTKLRKVR